MSDHQYDVLIADDEHYQEDLQRKRIRRRQKQIKRHYGYDQFGPEYDDIRIRKKWRKRRKKRVHDIEEMYD